MQKWTKWIVVSMAALTLAACGTNNSTNPEMENPSVDPMEENAETPTSQVE